ncbi:MAG: transcriptional coactivator p15/PC4 family protein [Armatimonadota bacterium]
MATTATNEGRIQVGSTRKNALTDVRVVVDDYRGERRCDVRLWQHSAVPDGDPMPTKAGISLRLDQWPAVVRLLVRALKSEGIELNLDQETREQ